MKFSELFLKNEKTPEKEKTYTEGRGLVFRIRPTGSKSFYLKYTFNGKQKKHFLGEYPTLTLAKARELHTECLKMLDGGIDPALPPPTVVVEVKEEDVTVEWIAGKYKEWSKDQHSKDWHSIVKCTLDKHIIPNIGPRNIISIRRRDALELMETISKCGEGAARNALRIVRGLFTYAVQREYIDASPFLSLADAMPSLTPVECDRVLSDKELVEVWPKIISGTGSNEVKRALLLILVTAQRPGEVIGMHSSEIDGEWWTVPPERVKTRVANRVYLNRTAKQLIEDTKGFIFPSPKLQDLQVVALDEDCLPHMVGQDNLYYGLPKWTPHDLRRTARTMMARLGVIDEVGEATINHNKKGMVKVYNLHKYDKEKRVTLLKLEREIIRVVGPANYRLLAQLKTSS